ncbi:MAG: putative membrane protein, partial [uncultured Pseudonocardia sp.]
RARAAARAGRGRARRPRRAPAGLGRAGARGARRGLDGVRRARGPGRRPRAGGLPQRRLAGRAGGRAGPGEPGRPAPVHRADAHRRVPRRARLRTAHRAARQGRRDRVRRELRPLRAHRPGVRPRRRAGPRRRHAAPDRGRLRRPQRLPDLVGDRRGQLAGPRHPARRRARGPPAQLRHPRRRGTHHADGRVPARRLGDRRRHAQQRRPLARGRLLRGRPRPRLRHPRQPLHAVRRVPDPRPVHPGRVRAPGTRPGRARPAHGRDPARHEPLAVGARTAPGRLGRGRRRQRVRHDAGRRSHRRAGGPGRDARGLPADAGVLAVDAGVLRGDPRRRRPRRAGAGRPPAGRVPHRRGRGAGRAGQRHHPGRRRARPRGPVGMGARAAPRPAGPGLAHGVLPRPVPDHLLRAPGPGTGLAPRPV